MNIADLYLSTNSSVKPKSIFVLFRRDDWLTEDWIDYPIIACFDFEEVKCQQHINFARTEANKVHFYIQEVEYKD